jgi:hypothetical protein
LYYIKTSYTFHFGRFSKVTENYGVNDVSDEEEKIKGFCNTVVTVTVSLQKATDLHDTIFHESVFQPLQIHYISTINKMKKLNYTYLYFCLIII